MDLVFEINNKHKLNYGIFFLNQCKISKLFINLSNISKRERILLAIIIIVCTKIMTGERLDLVCLASSRQTP